MDRVKFPRLNRRRFLLGLPFAALAAAVVDALWIEPRWLKVRRVRLATGTPSHRLVHFSDLHFKGDRPFAEKVVREINRQAPDFACFTGDLIGDLVDKPEHLREALRIVSGIRAPLYGVPGNHEYWSRASFAPIAETFSATGGAWLLDQQVRTLDGKVTLTGLTCQSARPAPLKPDPQTKNILLLHYPAWGEEAGGRALRPDAGGPLARRLGAAAVHRCAAARLRRGRIRHGFVPDAARAALCEPGHRLVCHAHPLQLPAGNHRD